MKRVLLVCLLVIVLIGCASRESSSYHSRDWDGDDGRCLAQLAMYMASDKSMDDKIMIINIAVNRVWADGYPDKIESVVNDMTGGMYINEEPNDDCWESEYRVQIDGEDKSNGATDFEIINGKIIPE